MKRAEGVILGVVLALFATTAASEESAEVGGALSHAASASGNCYAKRAEWWGTFAQCVSAGQAMYYLEPSDDQGVREHFEKCRQEYFDKWGFPCVGSRFVDDSSAGTVTDNLTGLVWEKKVAFDGVDDPSNPHDADRPFSWSDGDPWYETGTAFDDFLKSLNQEGFGASNGWRVPTITELQTLMAVSGPGTAPGFPDAANNADGGYWSSTTSPLIYGGCKVTASCAWNVTFTHRPKVLGPPGVAVDGKEGNRHIRAVHGGL